jgi:hypothetical protein
LLVIFRQLIFEGLFIGTAFKQKVWKKQKPRTGKGKGLLMMGWRLPTLPLVTAVPLALRGLTALFGMGRGEHPRYNHHYFSSAFRLMLLLVQQ